MTYNDKKRESNARYLATCDRIQLRPSLEEGQQIRAAAKAADQSLQGYILQACRERAERDHSGAAQG